MALLEVADLKVHFRTDDGIVRAVDGVTYSVERGRALGIVGESGSGKSVSSLTVMGLTRFAGNAEISGSIVLDGQDVLGASDEDLRSRCSAWSGSPSRAAGSTPTRTSSRAACASA